MIVCSDWIIVSNYSELSVVSRCLQIDVCIVRSILAGTRANRPSIAIIIQTFPYNYGYLSSNGAMPKLIQLRTVGLA